MKRLAHEILGSLFENPYRGVSFPMKDESTNSRPN